MANDRRLIDADDGPVIDAAEVVRCMDCKYLRPDILGSGKWCSLHQVWIYAYENDFCSRDEREIGTQSKKEE